MPKGITHGTPQSILCCAFPFERLPVFRQKAMALYHIPLGHTSRKIAIRGKANECDSGIAYSDFLQAEIMRVTRDLTWRTVVAGRPSRRATAAQLSPVAMSSR